MLSAIKQAAKVSFTDWGQNIPFTNKRFNIRIDAEDNQSRMHVGLLEFANESAEIGQELTFAWKDTAKIYHTGTETPDGGREIRAVFNGEEVVHSLDAERVTAIRAAMQERHEQALKSAKRNVKNLEAKAPTAVVDIAAS
tara:strand:+ start:422 stop:841 length:420 start_codon:yes stop_codon:yes gene_type:complete